MKTADTLSCEQLEERLAALHQASLELVQDISIDSLLQKIARIAIEQAGAKFAAIGVRGDNGGKERFITVGMSGDRIENLPNEPRGLSMLDVIAESDGPIRVEYIQKNNQQAGLFTEEPQMTA